MPGSMRLLCGFYAGGMRVVCGFYAGGMRVVCRWYAGGMRVVCGRYAAAMCLLCACYACCYAGVCPGWSASPASTPARRETPSLKYLLNNIRNLTCAACQICAVLCTTRNLCQKLATHHVGHRWHLPLAPNMTGSISFAAT